MKVLREENGQMLILTVLSMTVLFGFLAFATDVGLMFRAKRNAQIAADAAATAAAIDLHYGSSSTIAKAAGQTAATNNGFTNGSNGTNVYINTPPTYGYHIKSGFAEAIITQADPTIFMNMLGFHSMTVSARAVAGTGGAAPGCIFLDGTNTAYPDLSLQGSAYIGPNTTPATLGCAIYVAEGGGNAISITGSPTAYVGALNVVGTGSGNPLPNGETVNYGATPESNPFGSIVTNGEPTVPGSCTQTIGGNSYTNQTLTVAANSVVCFSGTNVDISGSTLTGGTLGDNGSTFVFEHGVVTSNGGNSTIYDGTLDVNQGIFNESTNANLNITAPKVPTIPPPSTTPPWNNGIAILIPATNTQYIEHACSHNPNDAQQVLLQFGSNSQTLSGYIYAPNATLTMHDQGGGVTASGIIASNLCLIPSTLVIPSYASANPYANPLTTIALVE